MSTAYHPLVQRALENLPAADSERFKFDFHPPNSSEEEYGRHGWFAVEFKDRGVHIEVFPQDEDDVVMIFATWSEKDTEEDSTLLYVGAYYLLKDENVRWPHGLYPHHREQVMLLFGIRGHLH